MYFKFIMMLIILVGTLIIINSNFDLFPLIFLTTETYIDFFYTENDKKQTSYKKYVI